jgi:UDP-N-acetylglucosamine--dolichyl-phosphate N-acetylglucosaminephosphotransferase
LFLALIGIVDDLLNLPQWLKAISPLFAAIPLVAVASNLTNMLAGFNGMETGMGIMMFIAMLLVALSNNSAEMSVMSISILGALVAFAFFNFYPAKVFPGDVGNLTIGAVLASVVIIGNLESAGVILVIPYVIDFFIKFYNRFPSSKWWGELKGGKLYAYENKVRGFCQLVMKLTNGITEKNLVLFFIGLEAIFAIIVLLLFF